MSKRHDDKSAPKILAPEDLRKRIDALQPGQSTTYYVGYLARDRQTFVMGNPGLAEEWGRQRGYSPCPVGALADEAMRQADRGIVDLVQRRIADGCWTYIAIKRHRHLQQRG